jgi:hypothetical protein
MRAATLAVSAVLLALAAAPAAADDGVIEISQARAQAGGVTPGDTAGFPVTLSQSGSYRLTGTLTVPTANTTAIVVTSVDVNLDLNGFAIQGPVVCTGQPVSSCAGGSGRGVDGSATSRTTVWNGIVKGLGSEGLLLGELSRVERVRVRSNGGSGITVGRLSQVSGCIAESNDGNGVESTGEQVLVEASGAHFNAASGFSLGLLSNVQGSTASRNGFRGIDFIGPGGGSAAGAFSGNTLNANQGSAVTSLAKATGGNVCSDGTCSVRGARRFYLTTTVVDGAHALNECAAGFHMASFYEIRETTSLEYVSAYGATRPDSGRGPVAEGLGWVRTGFVPASVAAPGVANCETWTISTPGTNGSAVRLIDFWSQPNNAISHHWAAQTADCSNSWPVWCVED